MALAGIGGLRGLDKILVKARFWTFLHFFGEPAVVVARPGYSFTPNCQNKNK
jgi:hypothetical protein